MMGRVRPCVASSSQTWPGMDGFGEPIVVVMERDDGTRISPAKLCEWTIASGAQEQHSESPAVVRFVTSDLGTSGLGGFVRETGSHGLAKIMLASIGPDRVYPPPLDELLVAGVAWKDRVISVAAVQFDPENALARLRRRHSHVLAVEHNVSSGSDGGRPTS